MILIKPNNIERIADDNPVDSAMLISGQAKLPTWDYPEMVIQMFKPIGTGSSCPIVLVISKRMILRATEPIHGPRRNVL
jgi:hypothetical protein